MEVKTQLENGKLRVFLFGELDHHSAFFARSETDSAINRHKPAEIELNFGGVSFMDSSGIGFVMGRYKLGEEISATVSVVEATPPIYKVMKLSGLEKIVKLYKKGEKNEK